MRGYHKHLPESEPHEFGYYKDGDGLFERFVFLSADIGGKEGDDDFLVDYDREDGTYIFDWTTLHPSKSVEALLYEGDVEKSGFSSIKVDGRRLKRVLRLGKKYLTELNGKGSEDVSVLWFLLDSSYVDYRNLEYFSEKPVEGGRGFETFQEFQEAAQELFGPLIASLSRE